MTGGCIHLLGYFNDYNKNLVISHHNSFTVSNSTYESLGGGMCHLTGFYFKTFLPSTGHIILDKSVLNRV